MAVNDVPNGGWGEANANDDRAKANNGGTAVHTTNNPFLNLFKQSSMMGQNNSITEMQGIREQLQKELKAQRETARDESVKRSIPRVEDMSTEQSPNLPGIIFSVVVDNLAYLMPVMFHKKGSVDTIESINFGTDQSQARPFTKLADSFMDAQAIEAVKAAYVTNNDPALPQSSRGKPITNQIIMGHPVISIDEYMVNGKDTEVAISNIVRVIMGMWYKAMYTFSLRATLSYTTQLDEIRPFRDGKLFGQDNSAYLIVDTVEQNFELDGRPSAYNLQVKSTTASKNQSNYNQVNSNNNKHIATTYLNVTIECMGQNEFMSRRQSTMSQPGYNGMTVGPLVAVISTGETKTGEQMLGNQNILSWMYGLFQSIAASSPVMFTEAIRHSSVGARGSLVNLVQSVYRSAGTPINNADILTAKQMSDPNAVQKFMQQYICPFPVYVLDIPYNTGDTSESNFLWKLQSEQKDFNSDSVKTLVAMGNILADNLFTKVIEENRVNSNSNKTLWVPGHEIMRATPMLIPVGVAPGKNGRWFNLEEIDDMLLHDPSAFGDNQAPNQEYRALVSGVDGKDFRLRQFEIKRMLDGLFSGAVYLTGWKIRHILSDSFLNTFGTAMTRAHHVRVSAPYAANTSWQRHVSSDYLSMGVTATLSSPISNNGVLSGTSFNYHFVN